MKSWYYYALSQSPISYHPASLICAGLRSLQSISSLNFSNLNCFNAQPKLSKLDACACGLNWIKSPWLCQKIINYIRYREKLIKEFLAYIIIPLAVVRRGIAIDNDTNEKDAERKIEERIKKNWLHLNVYAMKCYLRPFYAWHTHTHTQSEICVSLYGRNCLYTVKICSSSLLVFFLFFAVNHPSVAEFGYGWVHRLCSLNIDYDGWSHWMAVAASIRLFASATLL